MTAHFTSEAAIERIGLGLLDRSLPKAEWTHAAHFAAAVWLLRARPDIDAEAQMPGIISHYNESVGGENPETAGYHETITQASLRETRRFLAGCPASLPLHEAHGRLMASPLGEKDWLLAHWSKARLFSVEARRGWVEPDLQPLPA